MIENLFMVYRPYRNLLQDTRNTVHHDSARVTQSRDFDEYLGYLATNNYR